MDIREHLLEGHVIPAHPLALTGARKMDENSQRALTRYYVAAGAGGMAVGVHTTGFPIHDATVGLYEPVLALAAETASQALAAELALHALRASGDSGADSAEGRAAAMMHGTRAFVRVAGLVGDTTQALREASIAKTLGYHCGLLSLGAWRNATDAQILAHCREVANVIPLFGFYLQPAVGGRTLSYDFWRAFVDIPGVVAIKVAPFNRHATLDVMRAMIDSGRRDVALYTGNDDAIVADLLTDVAVGDGSGATRHFAGGLLGQWAVWTHAAVKVLRDIHAWRDNAAMSIPKPWLTYGAKLTEANAVVFDVANNFAGCLPGILHVLREQGLVQSTLTFDAREQLSPGQAAAIDAVRRRHPELTDDVFVATHIDEWLR